MLANRAVELIVELSLTPDVAWEKAALEIFPESETSRNKGCPKGTFLGLCEDGLVTAVAAGNYTKSTKNKEYGIKALELIKKHPHLTEDQMKLWKIVVGDSKAHNYQMDVVISLYNRNNLR